MLYGDTKQFMTQLGGATLCALWAFGVTFVVFKTVNAVKSIRVSREGTRGWMNRNLACLHIQKMQLYLWKKPDDFGWVDHFELGFETALLGQEGSGTRSRRWFLSDLFKYGLGTTPDLLSRSTAL